jgi:hypothetical protein
MTPPLRVPTHEVGNGVVTLIVMFEPSTVAEPDAVSLSKA